jgi:type I restriction enzyme M protein
MQASQLSWITNFIWGIADDVLRDLYMRGKYRDVILPMTVIRRLDTLLEPTKTAVLDMKKLLDEQKIVKEVKVEVLEFTGANKPIGGIVE